MDAEKIAFQGSAITMVCFTLASAIGTFKLSAITIPEFLVLALVGTVIGFLAKDYREKHAAGEI